jgi:HK97 family phage major capsid protein
MNRFDKQKLAIEKAIREEIDQYKSIYKKAEDEDRHPTDDERLDIESHLRAIDTLKEEKSEVEMNLKTLQHVDDIGRELGPAVSPVSVISEGHDRYASDLNGAFLKANPQMVDLGAQFVESAGYKSAVNAYRESGRLPSNFSTGAVALEAKGTLLEGAGGGGVGLVSVPQQVPGIVDKAFQPLTVADLLLSGQASTTSLRYVVEGTATSGAAGVAEGGAKPESALGFTTTDEPIKKIATILPVSEEMLEDAPAIQSYINGRLQLFVRIEEERQLVRGTSGGNEVQGLLTSRNVPVYAGGTAVGNRAEQLFKAMNGLRGSAFVEPEFIIMNPTDYEAIRLLKDTNGQLYGGGPFFGPYGGPQGPATASSQVTAATDTVWSKPTHVTGAIGAGTAIVGTRAAAQVWRRGGLSVEATNSHSTYFQLNLVAIRCEERLGLAVYRPNGFVEVRLS